MEVGRLPRLHLRFSSLPGRSLSMSASSTMQVNPDIDECFALKGWYTSQGQQQSFTAQSSANTGSSISFRRDESRTLEDVKQAGFGTGEQTDFFSTRATIMHIKDENIAYPACPTQGCNKKVVEEASGWRCEKCDKVFPAPEYRQVLWSLDIWVCFNETLPAQVHHLDDGSRPYGQGLVPRLQRCRSSGFRHAC
jgi:replication factor A1